MFSRRSGATDVLRKLEESVMRGRRRFLILVGVIISIFSLTIPAAAAVVVDGVQFNLQGGQLFYQIPPGELFIGEYHGDPDTISGHVLVAGGLWEDYEIRDAIFDLSESALVTDESYTVAYPTTNREIAKGQFDIGAMVTITGSITTQYGAEEIFPTGTILQAQVINRFWAEERQGLFANMMNIRLDLAVTGGELATGAVTGFKLFDASAADITLVFCSQEGNIAQAVEDFQSDIWYLSPSMVQIYPVPEPMSLGLLGLGWLLILSRKEKNSNNHS